MKRNKLYSLIAVTVMILLVLTGCGQKAAAPAGQTATAEPVKTINWKLASTWGDGTVLFGSDQRFAEHVNKMSNGRLKVTVYGAGQLAPANQVLDVVSNGTVEAGGDWPSYWTGKDTSFDLLGSNVMGFSNWDYLLWIHAAGGRKYFDQIYGKYNLVYFPTTISSIESGIRTNKPIKSFADIKGMKLRMAGLIQGKLIQEFGATPVTIATNELYESLQRGVIDGAEYSSPGADEAMKLHEVAKYIIGPGFQQTASVFGVMVNKDAWNKLPDDLKAIVEAAAKATCTELTATWTYNDGIVTDEMVKSGITYVKLTDEEYGKIEKAKNRIMEDLAKQNPLYAEVAKHQMDFYKDYSFYRDFLGAYTFGRNPAEYPSL